MSTATALGINEDEADEAPRRIVLTAASDIKPARVIWLWADRLAQGTLGLLAGREGLGKSTLAYWIVARVTRGELPGEHLGVAKAVLVCATEDSWEHTIVPRLIAANADLAKVYRVDVLVADVIHDSLTLPRDLVAMERHANQVGAALLLLDPLMSRLSEKTDTHRDGDVRRDLEPLVAVANRTGMGVLGIIHHNKSGSDDPLQVVMGSRAFTAVARSVHSVVRDPDDDTGKGRLFGTPKNNLGRDDLPTRCFTIEGFAVDTDNGPAWTGQVVWGEERAEGIGDAMRRANLSQEDRSATSEAMEWLADYITSKAGVAPSGDVKKAGAAAGHADHVLKRARQRLDYWFKSEGFPRVTYWGDPALVERDPTVGTHVLGEGVQLF